MLFDYINLLHLSHVKSICNSFVSFTKCFVLAEESCLTEFVLHIVFLSNSYTIFNCHQPNVQSRSQKEGTETEQFWNLLGGKSEYPSQKIGRDTESDPHLFSCTFSKGLCKSSCWWKFMFYPVLFVCYTSKSDSFSCELVMISPMTKTCREFEGTSHFGP